MYGLIGKMKVASGQREAVVSALLEGTRDMPGCLGYGVAHDPADPDAIWITETWRDRAAHQAALSLPAVQRAIAAARPHITGFGERFETVPVGGVGIAGTRAPALIDKHDELLLRDLRLQPLWMLWSYVLLGLAAAAFGLWRLGAPPEALLCVGGGFLVALGAEKLVTRRIRSAALRAVR